MKLIINIPEEAYELLKSKSELDNIAESIIANGTPVSNEGDLISRSALKEALEPIAKQLNDSLYGDGIYRALKAIDNAPTVELTEEQAIDKLYETGWIIRHDRQMTERPQGEWEEPFEMNGKSYHKCNRCHISSQLILIDNFCPNCGADMRGGKNETD